MPLKRKTYGGRSYGARVASGLTKSVRLVGPKLAKRYKKVYKPKTALTRAIKRTVFNMKELKYKDLKLDDFAMKHNAYSVAYKLKLFTGVIPGTSQNWMPEQGDTSHTRDGNEIYLSGIQVRLQLRFFPDRLNGKCLIHVVKVPKGQSIFAYEDVYDNITGNIMLDPMDKDKVKCIYKKTVYPGVMNPGVPTTGKDVCRYLNFFVPYKGTLRFQGDTETTHNMAHDYHLIIQAYDSANSLVSDDVASVQSYFRVMWRDK